MNLWDILYVTHNKDFTLMHAASWEPSHLHPPRSPKQWPSSTYPLGKVWKNLEDLTKPGGNPLKCCHFMFLTAQSDHSVKESYRQWARYLPRADNTKHSLLQSLAGGSMLLGTGFESSQPRPASSLCSLSCTTRTLSISGWNGISQLPASAVMKSLHQGHLAL